MNAVCELQKSGRTLLTICALQSTRVDTDREWPTPQLFGCLTIIAFTLLTGRQRSTGNDKNKLCPLTKINVNWLNVNWAAFWTQLYSLDVCKWAVLPEVWLWILAYLQLIEQLMFMHSAEIKVQALRGHQNPASSVYCKSTKLQSTIHYASNTDRNSAPSLIHFAD